MAEFTPTDKLALILNELTPQKREVVERHLFGSTPAEEIAFALMKETGLSVSASTIRTQRRSGRYGAG